MLLIAILFALDPRLLTLAPGNTRLLAGIHTDRAKSSELGRFLLERIQAEAPKLPDAREIVIAATGAETVYLVSDPPRRVQGRGGRGVVDRRLTETGARLGAKHDAWLVSIAPVADFSSAVPAGPALQAALKGDALKAVKQWSGGIDFGQMAHISGEALTGSPQEAANLADALRFVASLTRVKLTAAVEQSVVRSKSACPSAIW